MKKESSKVLDARVRNSIILLLLALVSISTATYAWFTITTTGKISEMSMEVTASEKLGISTTYSTNLADYKNDITTEMVNDALKTAHSYPNGLTDIKLAPLTSGDGYNLYTRSVNAGTGAAVTTEKKNYLELPLWFMSSSDMSIYLTADNSATGVTDGTSVYPTQDKGNTEKQDYVTKAVRMSFSVFTDGQGSSLDSTGTLIYEPSKEDGVTLSGQAASNAGTTTQETFDLATGSDKLLFKLSANSPKRVVVRLWLEGEDPQCINDDTKNINIEKAWLSARLRFVAKDANGVAFD